MIYLALYFAIGIVHGWVAVHDPHEREASRMYDASTLFAMCALLWLLFTANDVIQSHRREGLL